MLKKYTYEGDLRKNDYKDNVKKRMRWLILVLILIVIRIIAWIIYGFGDDKEQPEATGTTSSLQSVQELTVADTQTVTTGTEEVSMTTAGTEEASMATTGTEEVSAASTGTDEVTVMDEFNISEITDEIYARIAGISYPEDCSIPLEHLRYVSVMYVGYDGYDHRGEIIVNRSIAEDVVNIFKELYEIGYPVERMELVDEYGGDDELSMTANNTSAFNYRVVAGTNVLSNHAKGVAIDINPLYNPYVAERKDGSLFVQPACATAYVDRTTGDKRYILAGDECVRIFKKYGFTWGGDWKSKKDYQHFEKEVE